MADEVDGGFERCAGAEDGGYAVLFEVGDVLLGDGAAEDEEYVLGVGVDEKRVDAGDEGVVCSGEDGETDAVDVLLDGSVDDGLGGLTEAGVDDLHAGVAEGAGDDLWLRGRVQSRPGLATQDADGVYLALGISRGRRRVRGGR